MYLVTDTRQCGGPDAVVRTVRAAVTGGVGMVQLRDPSATTRELAELARALVAALAPTTVPLVVNDRADVALAVGADGVHIGQRDLDPLSTRRLVGPDLHVGLSISNADELAEAVALPAGTVDLLGVGPIRDTPSKTDASAAVGLTGLADLTARTTLPCVAIGGLGVADAAAVRAAGAVGMAVISAICGQGDPASATERLLRAWRSVPSGGSTGSPVPHHVSATGVDGRS
ncbi:thiamine phosphate synthase [Nakamurella flavida]|uniref:Thiamine-phosphate synthase n=1 Tax=Nakamurella flavida TaxID=363630 RepID=A0A938YKR6_9ACTN|nr:thiamine phosphate synthase [Nakamurella flavida]MBM9476351.1 thiamine phosphate synthase [Nakamurella flavida]